MSAWVLLALGPAVLAEPSPRPALKHEEVSLRSGGNILKGVLVLPADQGPHPAVAFVHGSGSLDRSHWTSHPPLREHVARHGIASLCWDKPGVGGSTGDWTEQSFRDRAQEALDAVKLLKGRRDIDAQHVGLWGISQGGWICPLAEFGNERKREKAETATLLLDRLAHRRVQCPKNGGSASDP
jgi:pimeloyl-ACP methyl ester carboxylesterase